MTDIVERLRADAEATDDIGLCAEAADVIDALRQQLVEEHEAHLIAEQRWIEQTAESQAREKVLRSYISRVSIGEAWSAPRSMQKEAIGLLNRPSDDTALKSALAAERERIAKHFDGKGEMFGDTVADAIRALGEEI